MGTPKQKMAAFLSKIEQLNLTARSDRLVVKAIYETSNQEDFSTLKLFLRSFLTDLLKPIATREETHQILEDTLPLEYHALLEQAFQDVKKRFPLGPDHTVRFKDEKSE